MAVTQVGIQDLHGDVLSFSLRPTQGLSQFSYPKLFEDRCKKYLDFSPPAVVKRRFSVLNFDGLIVYNYHKGPVGEEFEKCTGYATLEDVKNWKTAIKCLQRYCLNLILAPKRQDFYQIKFSTGFYQYNIAKNFKGAEKILEAMGYIIPGSHNAKPTLVKMQLKEPKKLVTQKPNLAKVLVDLVLFDFELSTLAECITEYKKLTHGLDCSIMEAWEARKNTVGGCEGAVAYLRKKCTNPSSLSHSANNVTEDKPLDLSALPPPDYGIGNEFGSVTRHINPSSYNDDDDNQLIKDSTLLGYRNPPEAKSQIKPTIQPRADPTGYPGGYRPSDWHPPTTSSPSEHAVAPPNKDDKFDNTHVQVSGEGQHQPVDSRGLSNELGYMNTRQPHMAPAAVFPDDPPKGGELHSLPSVTGSISGNADQLGSSPRRYKRQASIPNDTSLSGGSERMAGISTGATTNNNQLAVSDNNAVLTAAVPIIDQPTPETSQAPPDSKYGKTNLNVLKNRLQHKKEITQTVVQTEATSNYANTEMPYQGVSDNTTKLVADLTSLRNRLEKTKEVREKATAGDVSKNADVNKNADVSKNADDYCNLSDISPYIPENPVMINNPPDKRPMAVPRIVNPSNHANNDTRSALSASSSKVTCRLWQCAHCQTINEAHHTACEHCKLLPGRMADRSYFCNFCQMMIFIPVRRADFKDTCCPRCKHVYESVL